MENILWYKSILNLFDTLKKMFSQSKCVERKSGPWKWKRCIIIRNWGTAIKVLSLLVKATNVYSKDCFTSLLKESKKENTKWI